MKSIGKISITSLLIIWSIGLFAQSSLFPPINFHRELSCTFVSSSWEPPFADTSLIIGYNIYFDDTLYTTIADTFYNFQLEEGDSISFSISTLYENGESKKIKSTIEIPNFYGSSNLNGFIYPENECCFKINWTPPNNWLPDIEPITSNELTWSNNEITSWEFLSGPVSFAITWDQTDLQKFHGTIIEQIAFYSNHIDQNYSVQIWTGDSANNLIFDQVVPSVIPNDWNYINLDSIIKIDSSEKLWVGYTIESQTSGIFFTLDGGPANEGYGDWISLDNTWLTLSSQNCDYNNTIKMLTHRNPMDSIPYFYIEEYFLGFTYNWFVYYDTILEDCIIGYDNRSNEIEVIVQTRYPDCNYMNEIIGFTSNCQWQFQEETILDSPLSILILPGSLKFKHNAQIISIKIFNTLGQNIREYSPKNKEFQINTSNFEKGLYIIQVNSVDGSISRKVVLP